MKNILKKSAYLSVLVLGLSVVISCEEEFTDIKSGVVSNTEFSTNNIILDIEITQTASNNIASVKADNIGLPVLQSNTLPEVDYWLGVYNKTNAKKLTAGFVSQLGLSVEDLLTSEVEKDEDTIYNLDKVVLKIPYTNIATALDGVTTHTIENILGNTDVPTTVEVYRNPTFLNSLDPNNTSKKNSFASDFDYQETELLTETGGVTFTPEATNISYFFDRINRTQDVNSTSTAIDSLQIVTNEIAIPFLAIPLDLNKMKSLFWDKFNDTEFSTSEAFQTYFRGIILKASGNDGSLAPFNLSSTLATIDFLYSKTVVVSNEDNEIIKDVYSFSLSGVKNSIYETEDLSAATPGSFVVQGTAGLTAQIDVLGVNLNLESNQHFLEYANKDLDNNNYLDLEELATIGDSGNNENGLLINDADLTFSVNNALSSDLDELPQRLYVYQNKNNGVTPTHISDSYEEAAFFNGNLDTNETETESSYTFKITDYISDLLDGSNEDFSPLVLKVFNTTDNPIITGFLDENVSDYNWNPRYVVLYDENGTKKARLKISYTKKKN